MSLISWNSIVAVTNNNNPKSYHMLRACCLLGTVLMLYHIIAQLTNQLTLSVNITPALQVTILRPRADEHLALKF